MTATATSALDVSTIPASAPSAPSVDASSSVDAPSSPDAAQPAAAPQVTAAAAADSTQDTEVIVITGSRILSRSAVAPAPVLTLNSDDALFSGQSDLIDVVTQIPSLTNSINTAQTADQQGIEGDGDTASSIGVATLNLRSLGTKRTLVLVDGRRHVGGRAGDTAVDINTIPIALIDRVEVLTGGASAVYGADAVTGVVNFITKKTLDGIEARAQFGTNDEGHGSSFYGSVAAGQEFDGGRGSAMIAVEYRRQSTLKCGDADFCRDFGVFDDDGNPAAADDDTLPPRVFRPHRTFAISSANGRIGIDFDGDGNPEGADGVPDGFFLDTNGDGINDVGQTPLGADGFGDWVVDDGELRLFQPGERASFANQFGGDGIASGPFNFQSIVPERDSVVANAIVRYEMAEDINFFSDAKFVYAKTTQIGQVNGFNDLLTVTLENPFIPAPMRAALDSAIAADPSLADSTTVFVTRDFLDLGDNTTENERQTLRLVNGFEGKLGESVRFEAYHNYGRTSEEQLFRNNRLEDRFFAALDVVTDANGNPICRSELDPSAPPPPTSPFPFIEPGFRTFSPGDGTCQPFNVFGSGAASAEAVDFVTEDAVQNSVIDQHVAHISLTGDSSFADFSLPGGPIGFAAGFEYRREFSRFRPDGFSATGLSFDGTRVAGLAGDYDVWELFGELQLPILADLPGAEVLTLDLAARFADYSTVGSNLAWKIGGTWSPIKGLRVRGGYSVAVRAPNVGELFQTETAAFFRPIDPCEQSVIDALEDPERQRIRAANCAADGIPEGFTDPLTGRFAGVRSGNQNLDEETAKTYTVGLVGTPELIPGLTFSIDYFDIELDDAIDLIDSQDILNNCYDDPSGINNQFCAQFTRNRTEGSPTLNGLNFLRVSQLNLARRSVAGIDFEVNYALKLSKIGLDLGVLVLRLYGTRLLELEDLPNQDDESFVNDELKEIRRPEWIVNTGLRWQWDRVTVNYSTTFMSDQALDDVEIADADDGIFVNPFGGSTFIQNLSASVVVLDEVSIYGGINNLTDAEPLATSTSFPVSPLGRTFFLGLTSTL